MNLHDLFIAAEWPAVETALRRHYPDDTNLEGFRLVFEQMLHMQPEVSEDVLVITPCEPMDQDDQPFGETPADVYCLQPGQQNHYSISFTPRAEVLGMAVQPQFLYNNVEIVAHCLWEATWNGFGEQDVQDRMAELLRQVEEIRNQTPEERAKQQRRSDAFMKKLRERADENS